MKKRLLALLLAAVMVLCVFGCKQEPEPSEPAASEPAATEPATTEPAGNEALAAFDAACEAWKTAETVTLQIVTEKTTEIKGQTYTEKDEQTLTYAGQNTDSPMILLSQTVPVWEVDSVELKVVATDASYEELYTDGKLYVELEDRTQLSGEFAYEDLVDRYVPVVPLTAELYEEVSLDSATSTVTFSKPTAAESWAMPVEAELTEAAGKALLNPDGTVEYTYEVSYTYGPAAVKQVTSVKTQTEAQTVSAPENTDGYVSVQDPRALRMFLRANDLLDQSQSATCDEIDSIFSQAAAYVMNQGATMNFHGRDADMVMKLEYDGYFKSYASGEDDSSTQTVTYQDGKISLLMDGGVPTSTVAETEDVWEMVRNTLHSAVPQSKYWLDVTCEDLGSLYYLELTYSEDCGNAIQNEICMTMWSDPTFLNNMATAYRQEKMVGYLSIDKYTGVMVASGYEYEGYHTLDGEEYVLSRQVDQSVDQPSLGAYKEVTDELPPETEPEQKATPLFYHVTGEGGQEMWLLGTVHVGDERTGFLPQEIYDAFSASDALALECDTEAFDALLEEDEELQSQISDLYFYSDGSTISDHINEELHTLARKHLKATGGYNMNAEYMKPSAWSSEIENYYLRQGYMLTSEQGVEERLTKLAHEQEKKILEVESNQFQIEMLNNWSEPLMELLLQDTVDYAGAAYFDDVHELYELWCAGDEEAMRKELSRQVDTSEMTEEELAEYEANKHLLDEYNKAMSFDRNDGMLQKAIEYMESGEVVFYAVGLAHLLDDTNGLVDTLREAGYTVELVSYE